MLRRVVENRMSKSLTRHIQSSITKYTFVWDGFYQNRLNPIIPAKQNLLWTIGVSKLKQYDPHCIIIVLDQTDGLAASEDLGCFVCGLHRSCCYCISKRKTGRDRVANVRWFHCREKDDNRRIR